MIRTQYPTLPTLTEPEKPNLLPVKWDYPRTENLVVKHVTDCLNTPADKQNTPEFRRKCLIKEVDAKSNLFIGLDRPNFQNLVKNMEALKARDSQWQNRNQAYQQIRQDYSQRNNPEAAKVAVKAKPKVAPQKKKPTVKPTAPEPTNGGKFPPKKPGK